MPHTPGPWTWWPSQLDKDFLVSGHNPKGGYDHRVIDVRVSWCEEGFCRVENPDDAALIAAAPAMLELLKRLEWTEDREGPWDMCFICRGHKSEGGHAPDCELAAVLRAARGETGD